MRSLSRLWLAVLGVASLSIALTNCTNPYGSAGGGGVIPSPTPTATITPTPGPCGTADSNPNVVFVAMGGGIAAVTVSPYQSVSGYGVSDSNSDIPAQSGLINVTSEGGSTPITTQNTIQFFNGEAFGSPTLHSAYGFKQPGFPSAYAFPSPLPSPMATTIASGTTWFTGSIATEDPSSGAICFSPDFKLTKGVYYFGDVNYYASSKFRGILVVGTPTPGANARSRVRALLRPPYKAVMQ